MVTLLTDNRIIYGFLFLLMGLIDATNNATDKFIEGILNATPNSLDGVESFGKDTFSRVKEFVQGPCVKIDVSYKSQYNNISLSAKCKCLPMPSLARLLKSMLGISSKFLLPPTWTDTGWGSTYR